MSFGVLTHSNNNNDNNNNDDDDSESNNYNNNNNNNNNKEVTRLLPQFNCSRSSLSRQAGNLVHVLCLSNLLRRNKLQTSCSMKIFWNLRHRVVYKSRQPAKFAGFSARFCRLLSLLHESQYVEEMDPQPSTFHKTSAT